MAERGRTAWPEDEPIPLSALQHYIVCPRQVALIHLEQVWSENAETAAGRILHERVDAPASRARGGVRTATGLMLFSQALALSGRADAVEFHPLEGGGERPFPVEYKRGKPKRHDGDRVQLCAQALCLEEMLDADVPAGALFYGEKRRRADVVFDAALRERTRGVAAAVRALFSAGTTPPPVTCPACAKCSLRERCRVDTLEGRRRSVAGYLRRRLNGPATGDEI